MVLSFLSPYKPNPDYKGKWYAPLIDNPEYKGEWAPRKISNPSWFEDLSPVKSLKAIVSFSVPPSSFLTLTYQTGWCWYRTLDHD